ncbi:MULTISPECIES: TetR/AcrR family transcriptional regulator [Aurantimonas]|uniref:TetR/AcrR family transcriptional regulator n=1 Tax=Aurantimonas TaxID=182269 RepID=UPI00040EB9A8|nr:TetR/AcrR family transcriptional regulator [Aurantimonas coralicida]
MEAQKRKRRPAFDREEGVAKAQALFHRHGYDAVSIADLTKELEINPPSLYAAYGSKAELFERAMKRYSSLHALPLDKLLAPGRPPAEALNALLVASARQYGGDAELKGCLVTEGMRADDETARRMAMELGRGAMDAIHAYVALHHPTRAREISDYVLVTMRGLSSFACLGMSQKRLVEVARMAGRTLEGEFQNVGVPPDAA